MLMTTINCSQKSNIHLIIIPGGPGLSSKTLFHLEALKDDYHLHFLDMQGTGDDQYTEKKTFHELCSSISDVVKNCEGMTYLIGHSFGGLLAMETANNCNVDGVICLATPMSKEIFGAVSKNYLLKESEELKKSQVEWNKNPSNETFAKWLSLYGDLYFENDRVGSKGKLLLNDKVSFQFFLDNRSDALLCTQVAEKFKNNITNKLFLAGEKDGILPLEMQKQDALNAGFKFQEIKGANHFLTVDCPDAVVLEIKKFVGNNAIIKGVL